MEVRYELWYTRDTNTQQRAYVMQNAWQNEHLNDKGVNLETIQKYGCANTEEQVMLCFVNEALTYYDESRPCKSQVYGRTRLQHYNSLKCADVSPVNKKTFRVFCRKLENEYNYIVV